MNNPPFLFRSKNGQYLPQEKTGEKPCSICKKIKPYSDFYPRKNRPLGVSPQCRRCEKDRAAKNMRERRRLSPERARKYDRDYKKSHPEMFKNISLKKNYGIDLNRYKEMVLAQMSKCKICLETFQQKDLNVDHCHKTLKVRGLLCKRCNHGIGQLRDDISILERAIQYLKQS